LALQKTANGWSLPYTLPAGNYLYKFVVNGEWITDPANPHQITIDGNANSFIAVKPNFTFKLRGYATAHKVILSGTFNNWNETGYTMQHQGDEWVISLYLKPDKYLYKFIVDGQWIIDPANRLWEPNAENTGNSVLWID
jgi:type 1 glutamine amidotransferase